MANDKKFKLPDIRPPSFRAEDHKTHDRPAQDPEKDNKLASEEEALDFLDPLATIRFDLRALRIKLTLVQMSFKPDETSEKSRAEIAKSIETVDELLPRVTEPLPDTVRERENLLHEICSTLEVEAKVDKMLEELKLADA